MSYRDEPQDDIEIEMQGHTQEGLEGQDESDSSALISGKHNIRKQEGKRSLETSGKKDRELVAYFALVFIQGMHVLTFKISQMNGKYNYNTASAIAITELVKFFMSMGLHAIERAESEEKSQGPFFPSVSTRQVLSWTMLAICYCINNQITFAILQFIGPGQLSVGKSFAPMLTAMMLWIIYNAQINRLQWAAISLSVTGLITNQVCVPDDDGSSSNGNGSRYALALLFISCMITAVSSVFNAKFLQKGDLPLQINQMLLYSQGFMFNIIAYALSLGPSGKDIGFFEGYDNIGVILVLLSQSLIGLAISWVYLHGGAIVKTLAASTQAAILTVMDSVFFGVSLGVGNTAGAVTVIISSYVYFTFALKWEESPSEKKDILAGDVPRKGYSVELVCKNILGLFTAGATVMCIFLVLFGGNEKNMVTVTSNFTLSANSTGRTPTALDSLVTVHENRTVPSGKEHGEGTEISSKIAEDQLRNAPSPSQASSSDSDIRVPSPLQSPSKRSKPKIAKNESIKAPSPLQSPSKKTKSKIAKSESIKAPSPLQSPSNSDERALYEKKFDELWMPNVKSVATNFGRYNNCAKEHNGEIVLFLIWGHLRTFTMKLPNFHSFINAAPCKFVVIYTRDQIEASGKAWWGDRQKAAGKHMSEDPHKKLEEYVSNHDNTAYHIVKVFGLPREDRIVGATALAEAVAKEHGLPVSSSTITVQTRPDLLFSHTIDFKALGNGGMSRVKTKNWLFMPRHEAARTSGYDPQEGLLVGNLGWFTSKFSFEVVKEAIAPGQCGRCEWMARNDSVPELAEARNACIARDRKAGTLGHYFRRVQVFDSICNDATPLFMARDIKIHYYRLSGKYDTAVQRPGRMSWVNPKRPIDHGPLDLRKGATEIFFPANTASCFCGDRALDPNAHKAEIDAYNKKGATFPLSYKVTEGLTLKEKPF